MRSSSWPSTEVSERETETKTERERERERERDSWPSKEVSAPPSALNLPVHEALSH